MQDEDWWACARLVGIAVGFLIGERLHPKKPSSVTTSVVLIVLVFCLMTAIRASVRS